MKNGEITTSNSCNMDIFLDEGQPNMENFGELQYIIDRMPEKEQFVLRQYFVHGWTKTRIAAWLGQTRKVVDRILHNLRKLEGGLK